MDKICISNLFQERLNFYNSLDEVGFEEWVLHPGTLFGAYCRWWGNPKKRTKPHEGLDLCYYRTSKGEMCLLNEKTNVPVIFTGQIVKVSDDFLGSSVFIRHSNFESKGSQLYTIYGHIKLCDHMNSGEILSEGNIVGTIADARERGKSIPSHLHISVAWIPNTFHSEELSWRIIGDLNDIALVEPLSVIKCPYSITTDI